MHTCFFKKKTRLLPAMRVKMLAAACDLGDFLRMFDLVEAYCAYLEHMQTLTAYGKACWLDCAPAFRPLSYWASALRARACATARGGGRAWLLLKLGLKCGGGAAAKILPEIKEARPSQTRFCLLRLGLTFHT